MDEFRLQCRTCLKRNTNLWPLLNVMNNSDPSQTYRQFLNRLVQLELPEDQEMRMPQGLCDVCCGEFNRIHTFLEQIKDCNDKLVAIIADNQLQLDCLKEEAIDIPIKVEIIENENHSEDTTITDTTTFHTDKAEASEKHLDNNTDDPNRCATNECQDMSIPQNEDQITQSSKSLKSMEHIPCPVCGNQFKRPSLLQHLRKLHDIKQPSNFMKQQNDISLYPYECKQCDYVAKSKSSLYYHNAAKHTTEAHKLKCKFCPYSSLKKVKLMEHIKNEHKKEFKLLKKSEKKKQELGNTSDCSVSDDDSDDNRKEEEPITSSDDDDFIKTIIKNNRKISKSSSTDGEPNNSLARKCDECDKVFNNLSSLNAHKRTVHISEDKYKVCVHCGKSYKWSKDLQNHITKIHPQTTNDDTAAQDDHTTSMKNAVSEKRFPCPQCEFWTKTSRDLKMHIRTHTGEKPYICEICGNSFVRAYDLKKHSYLHTGEKPYKCPLCPKAFRVSAKLRKHKLVHTGERPYKCTECGKGFTQAYNLTVHKRTHLKEQTRLFTNVVAENLLTLHWPFGNNLDN